MTQAALDSLVAAVNREFPTTTAARTISARTIRLRNGLAEAARGKFRKRLERLRKRNEALTAQLANLSAGKGEAGRLTAECFASVFLASPVATGRALAKCFRDLLGPTGAVVSRPSIEGIRDAWVELYKPMVTARCVDMLAAGAAGARRR